MRLMLTIYVDAAVTMRVVLVIEQSLATVTVVMLLRPSMLYDQHDAGNQIHVVHSVTVYIFFGFVVRRQTDQKREKKKENSDA